ncbi:MAG: AraC family transcriptional regulator [Pseudomonadota bacterium]
MDGTEHGMDETARPKSRFSVRRAPTPGPLPQDRYHLVIAPAEGARIEIEGRTRSLLDRQIAAVSPGEGARLVSPVAAVISFRHEFFCIRVSRAEVFCDGVVFNRVSDGPIITMPGEEWALLPSRIDELIRIDRSMSALREERLIGCLRALLLACADARLLSLALPAAAPGPSAEILSFQDALEARYLDHPDAEELASACGMAVSRLARVVKRELGLTIGQALSERLAVEARLRLRSGEKTVKEVAYDLGFTDPLYFSRFFKRHFGAAPTDFFKIRD